MADAYRYERLRERRCNWAQSDGSHDPYSITVIHEVTFRSLAMLKLSPRRQATNATLPSKGKEST